MESRIGSLELLIRAPAERAEKVCPAAREFALLVLARTEELLESRAPGRILLMSNFPIRWRLLEEALGNDGELEAFACRIADALEEKACEVRAPPAVDQELVVFEDESHWRSEHLLWLAQRKGRAWFFEPLAAQGEPPGALLLPENRALARSVLHRLYVDGGLAEALGALSPDRLRKLATAVGVPDIEGATFPGTLRSLPTELDAVIRRLPKGKRAEVAALWLFVEAQEALDSRQPESRAERIPRDLRRRISRADTTGDERVESAFGGLFYLLSLALELGLGETLWKACLPEGRLLTEVAWLLLGPDGERDSAPALFGGADLDSELPSIAPEQQAEISLALLASLISALPQRYLTKLPEPLLGLVQTPAGRLLVAAERGNPFALFAWPANSATTIEDGVRAFLAAWPQTAPVPYAAPALTEIDRSARLRSGREASLSLELLLPKVSDLPAAALLAQSAGALGYLLAARAGSLDLRTASGLVERHLRVPARVTLSEEEMFVSMPMERIDLALRRAGLDSDPGWVPWLGKRVRFEFVESP